MAATLEDRDISFLISRDERDTLLRACIELRDRERADADGLGRVGSHDQAEIIDRHILRLNGLIRNLLASRFHHPQRDDERAA